MAIRFACPCGQELEAEPDHAGLATVCPQCRRDLSIPATQAPLTAAESAPFPTAVRKKTPPPRPPLTNRFNDDGTLARRKREAVDDEADGPRRERHYDDHDAHADEEADRSRRPRMRRSDRPEEPTGINWKLVGGSALVMLITGPWAALVIFGGGIPIYAVLGFFAGLLGVVRGLMGYHRD